MTIVLVLGLPVVALSAGLTAYESSMRTVHVQTVERLQVTARLTANVEGGTESGRKQPAQVRWTDESGRFRTGIALVKWGMPENARVPVWVDGDGLITRPPMNEFQARLDGRFVGGTAATDMVAEYYVTRACTRLMLDRRRYAQWDAEWDLVEPLWSPASVGDGRRPGREPMR
ncbi:hypothetical protein [Streptomyces sp. AS58]|uniref:Rv1733c family protein n=1 Tax=Streptomyces sp. AS58 TaxID=1519489 RepID=UPI001F2767AA|nr:hypothetical protein [Streptomyces sp. AS58]